MEFQKALQITKDYRGVNKDFVVFHDTSTGDLENYEYRYRPISKKGFTLLHYATAYGQIEMVKVLMENGASKSLCLFHPPLQPTVMILYANSNIMTLLVYQVGLILTKRHSFVV